MIYNNDQINFTHPLLSNYFKREFGRGAGNKKLPFELLNAPLDCRRNIIAAYFSGDGTVSKSSNEISALTKSKELAYNICDLLSTLGIFARIRKKIIRSGDYKGNKYYIIVLSGNEVLNFHRQINFLQPRKQKLLNDLVKKLYERITERQHLDMIPNFGDILGRICKDLEIKGKRGTKDRTFMASIRSKTQNQLIGKKTLQNLIKRFEMLYNKKKPYSEDLFWLKKLAYSDIYWDKIKTIKKIQLKEPEYGYDIGTENNHFLIANGNILTHNTQIIHQLCVNVQLPYKNGGLEGNPLYIDTEGTFRPERIKQIATERELNPYSILNNITYGKAYTSDQQIKLIHQAVKLIKEKNIKLIIVDSLMTHFRSEYVGRGTLATRQQTLNTHLHDLTRLCEIYPQLVIVCTNQVSSNPDPYGVKLSAVGGNIVSHGFTTIIMLRKGRGNQRIAKITDSPWRPEGEAIFTISSKGIE